MLKVCGRCHKLLVTIKYDDFEPTKQQIKDEISQANDTSNREDGNKRPDDSNLDQKVDEESNGGE